jgi:hypothetical protein
MLRLWSIVLGAVALYAAYRACLHMWPESQTLVALGVAIFAFNPSFVFMSSTVHNDVAITALYALGTWWAMSLVRRRSTSLAFEALGGLLLGLAALAKTSGLGLAGVYVIAIALRAWGQGSWKQMIRPLALSFLVAGAVAGWWYVRNWQLYGDLLAWSLNQIRFKQMVRTTPYSWLDFLVFLTQIGGTFWGAFGYTQLKTSYLIYAIPWTLLLAAGIGLNVLQARRWTADRRRQSVMSAALAATPLLVMAIALAALYASPQRRHVWPLTWVTVTNLIVVGVVVAWLLALVLALARTARCLLKESFCLSENRQQAIVLVSSLLILAVALFRYSLGFGAVGFGRLLFPAMAAIIWLALEGWKALVGRRWLPELTMGTGMALLAYSMACIPWIVWPSYRMPSPVEAEAWQSSRPVDVSFDEALKLVAAKVTPDVLSPGEESVATLHLYWQSLTRERWDTLAHVRLVDPAGQEIVDISYWPVDARFPPTVWDPEAVYADHLPMIIPKNAYTGRYEISVRAVPRGSSDSLPVFDAEGKPIPPIVPVGELLVAAQVQPVAESEIPYRLDVQLGESIRLRGYDLEMPQSESDQTLKVTLYWQATQTISEDYTVFVQVLDQSGRLVTQKDNQPVEGTYPTSVWQTDVIVPDTYLVPIPPQVRSGDYRMIAGMYLFPSLERLPVTQDGHGGTDYVTLTSIPVP